MKNITSLLLGLLSIAAQGQVTHELTVSNFQFSPPVINAVQGDSLRIIPLASGHTFTQVSPATWEANGNTPDGPYQFAILSEEITVELLGTGIIHYVCSPHADQGMKGIVNVELASGMSDQSSLTRAMFSPNPASDFIRMQEPAMDLVDLSILDAGGREVKRTQFASSADLFIGDLPAGIYLLRVMHPDGTELQRQQLVVAH